MATRAPTTINLRYQPPYRGRDFVRLAKSMALGTEHSDMGAAIAKAAYGEDSLAFRVLDAGGISEVVDRGTIEKAEVPAGGTVSGNWGRLLVDFEAATTEFFGLVRDRSLIGRLESLRRVPLRTRLVSIATGFSAAWVGEGKAKPVGKAAFAQSTLPRRKVTSLIVLTEEHLRHADTGAEMLIRDDMAGAMADAIDASFINPANAGEADVEPASIAYGVTADAATGSTDGDIRDAISFAIANFTGDLTRAAFVGRPELLAYLGLNSQFYAEQVGARGGSLGGIPALPSRALPLDSNGKQQLVLVDPTGIAYGEEGMDLRTSREASIEMLDSNLTGDSIGVTGGTAASLVSLWSTNSVGLLAEKYLNFEVARAGSVRVITGLEGGVAS